MWLRAGCADVLVALAVVSSAAGQAPPPAAGNGRPHPRLEERNPPGVRHELEIGTLYLPPRLGKRPPLLVFFHGGTLVPEIAAAQRHMALISIQVGSGSDQYGQAFENPARLPKLIREAEARAHQRFGPLTLGGWSAGCGAIRKLLRTPAMYRQVAALVCIDGVHTGYVNGGSVQADPALGTENLSIWVKFAKDAVAGRKRMLITHSEVFPGTFASTTETADYILARLRLRRRPMRRHGPMGTELTSDVRAGQFRLLGFAGDSAADHVDQLHSLPQYLRLLR